ncbi:MAG: hypothetical protein K2K91_00455 [Ruminococcus sp.]|nr:hypothetical protein [Ruminococcus sp.]
MKINVMTWNTGLYPNKTRFDEIIGYINNFLWLNKNENAIAFIQEMPSSGEWEKKFNPIPPLANFYPCNKKNMMNTILFYNMNAKIVPDRTFENTEDNEYFTDRNIAVTCYDKKFLAVHIHTPTEKNILVHP